MSGYRQIITEVVALIEEYGDSLTLQSLSDALDVPVDTIRQQVRIHDVDVPIDRLALVPEIWIEAAAELDGDDDPAAASPQDLVRIGNGTDYSRRVLGTERFGAAVLGPLYEAAPSCPCASRTTRCWPEPPPRCWRSSCPGFVPRASSAPTRSRS